MNFLCVKLIYKLLYIMIIVFYTVKIEYLCIYDLFHILVPL